MSVQQNIYRQRLNFSKIRSLVPIPNLIEVQKNSYERFLQMDLLPSEREDTGLQAVFNSVFPITDFRGVSQLFDAPLEVRRADFVDEIAHFRQRPGAFRQLDFDDIATLGRSHPAAADAQFPQRKLEALVLPLAAVGRQALAGFHNAQAVETLEVRSRAQLYAVAVDGLDGADF